MMKPMFEYAGSTDIESLTVTEGFVLGKEDIKITYKQPTEDKAFELSSADEKEV